MLKIKPIKDYLKFQDIIEYQSCIDFIDGIKKEIINDEKLLEKVTEKFAKDDLNKVLNTFKKYFNNYVSIKLFGEGI